MTSEATDTNPNQNTNEANSTLYALAVIVDDLKSDEVMTRINAISKLPTVALSIGPERTRAELLPFIKEASYDEDESLLPIANVLGNFVTFVGGPEHAYLLLQILEVIMSMEETVCREAAVVSARKVITSMPSEHLNIHAVPIFERLAGLEWIAPRCSAVGIFTALYTKLDEHTNSTTNCLNNVIKVFNTLTHDASPIVRRAAGVAMKEFVAALNNKEKLSNEVYQSFLMLMNDDQDNVRVVAADVIPEFFKVGGDELKDNLLNEINKLFRDRSWRIRYKMAQNIVEYNLPFDKTNDVLVLAYQQLLRDVEPEVRAVAAQKLVAFFDMFFAHEQAAANLNDMRVMLIAKILPSVKDLTNDINNNVKSATATVLLKLSKFFGREKTIEHLWPLFHVMLRDQSSDVRLNVISNLGDISQVIGANDLSQSLLPTIIELAEDVKWRVRLAIIEFIPTLGAQLGVEFFDEKLVSLVLSWLTDQVYAIREQASKVILSLVDEFGVDWTEKNVFPKIQELAADESYLRRMTSLFTINMLTRSKHIDKLLDKLASVSTHLVHDNVANVRFNSVKTLSFLASHLNKSVLLEKVIPIVERVTEEDLDGDVKFFGQKYLTEITRIAEQKH